MKAYYNDTRFKLFEAKTKAYKIGNKVIICGRK